MSQLPAFTRSPPVAKLDGCSSIDQYSITRKLGEGTFGHVHQGTFKATRTPVALKEIITHKQDEGIPITALREIKIMKALRHTNLLHVLDMAVQKQNTSTGAPSIYYMVMSYMDHDLCGLLHNRDIRFSLPHIKLYMSQLLAGVGFLHEMQYMHRDIKSANVLVSNSGNLKVADFGLARKFAEAPPDLMSTAPAARKYTPKVVTRWYRPPELLLGEQFYTCAIDMWGVGCIFGEFFQRREILPGHSDMDQIHQIFTLVGTPTEQTMPTFAQLPVAREIMPLPEKPSTMREVFSTVPDDALDLLRGLLALDPLKRFTAKRALDHAFFTQGVSAAKYGELPKFPSSRELDVRRKRDAPSPLPPPPPEKRHHSNNNRFFNPKIPNKRELKGQDLMPPYRRLNPSRSADHRRSHVADAPRPEEKVATVMSNGLDY